MREIIHLLRANRLRYHQAMVKVVVIVFLLLSASAVVDCLGGDLVATVLIMVHLQ